MSDKKTAEKLNDSLNSTNEVNQSEQTNETSQQSENKQVEAQQIEFVEADTAIFKFHDVLTKFTIQSKTLIDSWTKDKSKYKENEGLELLDSDIATLYGYNCIPENNSSADKTCKNIGYYPCFLSYSSFNEGQKVLVQKIAGKFVLKAIR